jgi:hypothetical protein
MLARLSSMVAIEELDFGAKTLVRSQRLSVLRLPLSATTSRSRARPDMRRRQ